MRLGTKSSDEFMQELGRKNENIQDAYLQKIKELTETAKVKVMLGDSTVTTEETFDPGKVQGLYQKIAGGLDGWSTQDVTISNNEDIRRIFLKFEMMAGNYLVSGHMSIQFHVLLYYRPDQRVIDCQKELSEIIDTTKSKEQQISDEGDRLVLHKLKEMGYENPDEQSLFEIFYKDDELREKIHSEIEGGTDAEFKRFAERKINLFAELDSLLLETYQTSPVLIDDTRLIAGEEGCLCTFDVEFVKNNTKEGLFDPRKMPSHARTKISQSLDEILRMLAGPLGDAAGHHMSEK